MAVLEVWNDMSRARKTGFVAGAVTVVAVVGACAYWLLSVDYEPVMHGASPEKAAVAIREIERLKVPYRVSDDGLTVEVPRSELGRVKVGLAGHGVAAEGAGFELFNNTDFSTTEFTQKINFQRALQGELARTITTIEGVSAARVHIVLPDSGFLRRKAVQPTAAVNITMNPGAQLTGGQVFGIQKLVAASVPEIKLDDITVIDQDGIALTRSNSGEGDPAKRGQLELKREVDVYLEGKLKRVLAALDPQGEFSVSVDATLNASHAKVTTEDVLPVDDGSGKSSGALVRERQSQRRDGAPAADGGSSSAASGSLVREVEYKFGHRVEEVVTAPGGIDRLSVAVLARSGNLQTDAVSLRALIANAVGAKEADGDSIAVVMLPANPADAERAVGVPSPAASQAGKAGQATALAPTDAKSSRRAVAGLAWLFGVVLVCVLGWLALRRSSRPGVEAASPLSESDVDRIAQRINTWLEKDPAHAHQ